MIYKYFNWVDMQDYCLATGKWREVDAIAPRLKLDESERRDLRILYWRESDRGGRAGWWIFSTKPWRRDGTG
jgi:hypothetical protein